MCLVCILSPTLCLFIGEFSAFTFKLIARYVLLPFFIIFWLFYSSSVSFFFSHSLCSLITFFSGMLRFLYCSCSYYRLCLCLPWACKSLLNSRGIRKKKKTIASQNILQNFLRIFCSPCPRVQYMWHCVENS